MSRTAFDGPSRVIDRVVRLILLQPECLLKRSDATTVTEPETAQMRLAPIDAVDVQFHGAGARCVLALADGSPMIATTAGSGADAGEDALAPGRRVWLTWSVADMHLLHEPDS